MHKYFFNRAKLTDEFEIKIIVLKDFDESIDISHMLYSVHTHLLCHEQRSLIQPSLKSVGKVV